MRKREPLRSRVAEASPIDLAVTSMTEAELLYGALNSSDSAGDLGRVKAFVATVGWRLPFDSHAARRHAELRQALRTHPIGERDLVIASTTIAHGGVLVTSNVREFSRVPGLSMEDWTTPA